MTRKIVFSSPRWVVEKSVLEIYETTIIIKKNTQTPGRIKEFLVDLKKGETGVPDIPPK